MPQQYGVPVGSSVMSGPGGAVGASGGGHAGPGPYGGPNMQYHPGMKFTYRAKSALFCFE